VSVLTAFDNLIHRSPKNSTSVLASPRALKLRSVCAISFAAPNRSRARHTWHAALHQRDAGSAVASAIEVGSPLCLAQKMRGDAHTHW